VDVLREALGFTLLFFSAISALGAWLYTHKELSAIRGLQIDVFRHGPVVLSEAAPGFQPPTTGASRQVIQTRGGRFRILSSGEILFAPSVALPLPVVGFLNLFMFKGSISSSAGVVRVRVRAPTGSAVFLASFGVALVGLLLLPEVSCKVNGVAYPASAPECRHLVGLFASLLVLWAGLRLVGIRIRAGRLINHVRESLPAPHGAA
jgi:hypothetical protein